MAHRKARPGWRTSTSCADWRRALTIATRPRAWRISWPRWRWCRRSRPTPRMAEGLLPPQRALDEREENPSAVGAATEMAEERRLCYVGMTRAKDRLYLSCAFRRHLYGRSQPAFPSRFLTEIPQSMLAAPKGSAPVAPPRQGYKERYQERQVQAAP